MEITDEEAKRQLLPDNPSMRVYYRGNVAIIEMNYGENRLNVAFIRALNKALDQVESNPKVEALITTGKGKFYSNGVDLNFMSYVIQNDPSKELAYRRKEFNPLMSRILTFRVPTIAAINGHAFAGGGVLALCHDYRIMQTSRGWFCLNEIRLGLKFSPFLLKVLQTAIPRGPVYHDTTIMGRRYTAEEAKAAGIVVSTCAPTELLDHCVQFSESKLAHGSYNHEHFHQMKLSVHAEALEKLKSDFTSFSPAKI